MPVLHCMTEMKNYLAEYHSLEVFDRVRNQKAVHDVCLGQEMSQSSRCCWQILLLYRQTTWYFRLHVALR